MPPETELTLGLPGGGGGGCRERSATPTSPAAALSGGSRNCKRSLSSNSNKRAFVETGDVDLDLLSSNGESTGGDKLEAYEATSPMVGEVPTAEVQMVGWPPVRSFQKKVLAATESCKYVKVAADGAPYLRKVDLEMYNGYKELLKALQELFACFSILGNRDEGKLVQAVKGIEYVPTYEDRDGDLMLVGDVPWKMFTESCKRIRLMKSSEAVGSEDNSSSCTSTNLRPKSTEIGDSMNNMQCKCNGFRSSLLFV